MFIVETILDTTCNLGCYFCFAKNKNKKVVKLEKLKEILENIDNITNENEIQFKYYGGEAMLSQDLLIEHFKTILSFKSTKKFNLVLVTNGTIYPKPELVEMIKRQQVAVSFSMEGNKKRHDNIRKYLNGKGSFDDVINNIEKLHKETGCRFTIQTVMSEEWINNIDEYLEFTDKYKNFLDFCVIPMFGYNEITESMLKNFSKALDKYRNKIIDNYLKTNYSNIIFFQEMRGMMKLYYMSCTHNTQFHCLAGFEQITLVGDDLYPCSRAYHNDMFFSKYENLDDYKAKNEFYKEQVALSQHCLFCQKKNNIGCIGKCLFTSYLNNNDFIDEVCKYNIIFGKHINKLFKSLIHNEGFQYDLEMSIKTNMNMEDKTLNKLIKFVEVL